MKLYITILVLVLFTASLDIKAVAKPKKCLKEIEEKDVFKEEATAAASNKMKDPAAVKAVAEGNANFGLRLYEKVKEENGSNLLMSTYSVSSVMAMLSVGARKKTLEQIMEGMCFPNMKELLAGYSDVFRLTKGNENFTLETANELFVMEKFQLLEDFVREVKQYFHAQVIETNFAENGGEISRKLINDWVEEKTNNKITDLIRERMLDSSTKLVLVNAIYFKGNWASRFNSSNTLDEPFHVKEDETVNVQMMRKSEEFKMTYIQELNSKAIELPYEGNRVSMYIILPTDEFGFQDMEINLAKINLIKIFEIIDEAETMNLTLALPKFKLEKTIGLKEILKNLGMDQMFTAGLADFSGMTGNKNLYVSDAIQKAFIEVNEEGSEVSAATALIVDTFSEETPKFLCDHPFVFFIRDKETNMVLFSGRVIDPTEG